MESPDKSQQDTQSEDLGDAIAETYDEMAAASDEGEEIVDGEEVEVSAEADEEGTEEVNEREKETELEASEEVDSELKDEIQDAADSDYSEPAPERWADDIKEVYNSLPPHARKAMLEGIYKPMQRSYTQSTQELAKMREQVKPMLETFEQYRGDFDRMGVNPVEAFRTQLAWAAHLNKVGAEQGLRDMQAAYGLGNAGTGGQEDDVYLTPTERKFKEQLDALQQQVGNTRQTVEQSNAAAAAQKANAFKAEVHKTLHQFVNEKAEDGSPKHPHMEKVASGVAGILRGGLVKTVDDYGSPLPIRDQIEQAYHMACNLDPSIRPPAPNKRQAGRVKNAQKVSVVTKHPANNQTDVESLPMSSFIEQTYDELNSRG
jgi:hypothetical protein